MGKIKILADRLINKIAAGEIVERPASIVKELVENSLDAGASTIEIEVHGGGLEKVRVKDDGFGMDKDDLVLAFERHATSKIFDENDLFSISTMGFRGEAIPSMASVSIMMIRSGTDFQSPGHEIRARGGKIIQVMEVQPCKGTTVEVSSIFFNTPARKKFIKSPGTELSHITDCVHRFALSFQKVRFVLRAGGKDILNLPPVEDRLDRIAQLYGTGFLKNLVRLPLVEGAIRVEGYSSGVSESRKNRSGQYFFINGRSIKDRTLSGAVMSAYRDYFKGNHPFLFLFLHLDPSHIDVNVHPSKLEVRFKNHQEVYRVVRGCMLQACESIDRAVPMYMPSDDRKYSAIDVKEKEFRTDDAFQKRISAEKMPLPSEGEIPVLISGTEWNVIGQHRDTYIIASRGNDLYIIDQHIAHERVLYEDFLDAARSGRIEKQRLMFPITLELSAAEVLWIETKRELLAKTGLAVEHFGSTTIKIEEIPSHLRIDSAVHLVKDIAALSEEENQESGDIFSKLICSLACHSAVRAGEKLPGAKMEFIVESLFRCSNPHVCPHGRPIFMRLEVSDFARHFKRRS